MRLAAVGLCAALVLGSALQVGGQRMPPHDPTIEALVAETARIPQELGADALIRLAGSPKITQAEWRVQLLDDAFQRAYYASDAHRRATSQVLAPDSRQGAQLFASATSLNRVSLQVRAAELVALTDPRRGRELFDWIDLNLAPATCEDPLVPAGDEYYSALSLIARTTFGADRGEGLRFLSLNLWRAHLPSEMPAVARAMQRFRALPDEAAYLETLFRLILELMPSSAVRPRALDAFVDFMRHTDTDRDRRPLWFAFLSRLLEMARGSERDESLAALENSHHPVMSLYARLERVVPTR